jgi:cyclic pyranopterin phosphate synthase
MVDISGKQEVPREAVAAGSIFLGNDSLKAIREGEVRKGDVLMAARIAAIQAVKATPDMLAFCHPIPIESVKIKFEDLGEGFECRCLVKARYRTGVEMEALTGVSIALLTIWDMVKYLEKDEDGQYPATRMTEIRVISKRKGE